MNQTNNKEFQGKRIDWQQTLDTSKEIAQGLYKILKGLGRYAWSSLKRNASNRLKVFIIALVVSLLYIIPFLTSNGALYGDDLHFHIDRMLGLATIKESPVNFKSFYKVGQGINFFYPYLTYYPYYLLYKLTNSLYAGWMIYIYLLTIVTYLISYYSCKGIIKKSFNSHIFALFYTFSAYRLDNIIVRFAVGEVIAITFIPLTFYGLYLILKGNYHKWYHLTLGMSLLIYSHILSGFMTSVFIGLIYLTTIWFSDKRSARTYSLAVATVATLVVCSFQIFPMLEQFSYSNSKISGPINVSLNLNSKSIGKLFEYSFTNDITKHTPGLLVLASIIFSLFKFLKFKKEQFFLLAWIIILFILESNLIAWPESPDNLVSIIQFPWRLNSYITLFSSYLVANLVKSHPKNLNGFIALMAIVGFTVLNFNGATRAIYDRSSHKVNYASELSKRNHLKKLTDSIHVMDYGNQPKKQKFEVFDQAKKTNHQVVLNNTDTLLQSQFTFKNSYAQGTILNDTGQEQIVELPFYRYKGQIVTLDGKEVPTILSDSGATTIHFPAGQHKVKITYEYTAMAKVAHAASIMALLMIILYMLIYNLLEKYKIDLYFDRKRGLMIYPA
ncbi:hypothetical protein [Streptococcus sobrinus]|uniref:hypothetical protein n=1 Tax=Streptococcus sobrinus TaxID=1310 RepID=UPI0002E9F158